VSLLLYFIVHWHVCVDVSDSFCCQFSFSYLNAIFLHDIPFKVSVLTHNDSSYNGILLAVLIIILICMLAPMLNLIWSVPFPISIMHTDVLLLLFLEMWCEACSCLLWLCTLSYWPGSIKKGELCRSCQLGYMEGNLLFRGIAFLFSFLRAYYLCLSKKTAITKMEACELQWHRITLLRILLFCNFAINLIASWVLYKLKMVLRNERKS